MVTKYVIGIDEVGYGAWAGPLYVCAVAAEVGWVPSHLKDSKKLSKKHIAEISASLRRVVPAFALVFEDSSVVDRIGVGKLLRRLQKQAAEQLLMKYPGSRVVVDGNIVLDVPNCEAIPKADNLVPAVSAASIIAKDARDRVMREYAKTYPKYGFDRHVGYGTAEHKAALEEHGVCPLHRRSYRPIADLLSGAGTK